MTPEQWSVLVKHNVNRQNEQHEIMMGYIEYLATLVSPHPKETVKAIESRRKHYELEKVRSGEAEDSDIEKKLFHDDHRNTTFYKSIAEEGGEEALNDLKTIFNEKPDLSKAIEMYEPKAEDLEFIEKALKAKSGDSVDTSTPIDFDSIEF